MELVLADIHVFLAGRPLPILLMKAPPGGPSTAVPR